MFYYFPGRSHFPPPRGRPLMGLIEKADPIITTYDWGRWYQTVHEVIVEVNLPPNTQSKDLNIVIKPNKLSCMLKKQETPLLKGKLHEQVQLEQSSWSHDVERQILRLILCKLITSVQDNTWDGLFKTEYLLDPETAKKVRNRIDLERFHLEVRF